MLPSYSLSQLLPVGIDNDVVYGQAQFYCLIRKPVGERLSILIGGSYQPYMAIIAQFGLGKQYFTLGNITLGKKPHSIVSSVYTLQLGGCCNGKHHRYPPLHLLRHLIGGRRGCRTDNHRIVATSGYVIHPVAQIRIVFVYPIEFHNHFNRLSRLSFRDVFQSPSCYFLPVIFPLFGTQYRYATSLFGIVHCPIGIVIIACTQANNEHQQ